MVYQSDFLTAQEEQDLVALLRGWPLEAMRYKGYTARRRVRDVPDFEDVVGISLLNETLLRITWRTARR